MTQNLEKNQEINFPVIKNQQQSTDHIAGFSNQHQGGGIFLGWWESNGK